MFTRKNRIYTSFRAEVLPETGLKSHEIVVQAGNVRDFQLNAYGFPLNDIAALNGAKSVQEYNAIIARLNQYVADNPDHSKMSIKDIIGSIMPRSFQTPSEVERAGEFVGSYFQDKLDAKLDAARLAQIQKARENVKPADSQPVEYQSYSATVNT